MKPIDIKDLVIGNRYRITSTEPDSDLKEGVYTLAKLRMGLTVLWNSFRVKEKENHPYCFWLFKYHEFYPAEEPVKENLNTSGANYSRNSGANMKYLYKLKLNNHRVGYCRWHLIGTASSEITSSVIGRWEYSRDGRHFDTKEIPHNTIHPYVTDDKNGKPVFAGDRVSAIWDMYGCVEDILGYVRINDLVDGAYIECKDDVDEYWLAECYDIELIEEPE